MPRASGMRLPCVSSAFFGVSVENSCALGLARQRNLDAREIEVLPSRAPLYSPRQDLVALIGGGFSSLALVAYVVPCAVKRDNACVYRDIPERSIRNQLRARNRDQGLSQQLLAGEMQVPTLQDIERIHHLRGGKPEQLINYRAVG